MARTLSTVEGSNGVVGVDEFQRALRRMDKDLYKEFNAANRAIGKMVVQRGRDKATAYSKQAAKASKSMRATASRGGVGLKLGGTRWPYAMGAEYGALKYRQFPEWRGNQYVSWDDGVGYFFHPAIRESKDEVLDLYLKSVEAAAAKAGLPMGQRARRANVFDAATHSTK